MEASWLATDRVDPGVEPRNPGRSHRPGEVVHVDVVMIQSPTMIAKTESTTSELTVGIDPAWTRPWLRAEGLATFVAGLAGFLYLGLPWWAFALLLIVPDVSMVGYLRGPRLGAIVYNVAHDLATGAAIAGVGLAIGSVPVAAAGTILVAHSGMDRMMGYGSEAPKFVQGHPPRPDRPKPLNVNSRPHDDPLATQRVCSCSEVGGDDRIRTGE